MHAHSHRVVRTLESTHCIILSLSTFLAGLYFGKTIPEGVNLLMLQVGVVGIVGALGLANLSAVRYIRRVEDTEECQVEQRLMRHTSETQPRDHATALPTC
jgi:hypothetical protein